MYHIMCHVNKIYRLFESFRTNNPYQWPRKKNHWFGNVAVKTSHFPSRNDNLCLICEDWGSGKYNSCIWSTCYLIRIICRQTFSASIYYVLVLNSIILMLKWKTLTTSECIFHCGNLLQSFVAVNSSLTWQLLRNRLGIVFNGSLNAIPFFYFLLNFSIAHLRIRSFSCSSFIHFSWKDKKENEFSDVITANTLCAKAY